MNNMEKKKYTDKELKELDNYLQDTFNNEIYTELKYTDYSELFEPLEFFRIFYSQVTFIKENKAKPSIALQKLGDLNLSDGQKYIVLDYLDVYFADAANKDADIRICSRKMEHLKEELEEKLEIEKAKNKPSKSGTKDEFQELLKQLKTLPTYKEKIAYLIKEKTRYEQNQSDADWNIDNEKTFAEKCDLEIKKLEKLSGLETAQKLKFIEVAKHRDLTIDRVIFLLNRLIPSFSDCEATKKAEFINFLTGFDYETTRQRFSSINRKDAEKPQAFKKDMEIVCKYLDLLGLNDISSQIKRDLDFW